MEHDARPAVRLPAVPRVEAEHPDRSLLRGGVAFKDVEQGRLPCSVRAEHGCHLAGGDVEIDVAEHLVAAEAMVDAPGLDDVVQCNRMHGVSLWFEGALAQ